jgi:hypothetical protein
MPVQDKKKKQRQNNWRLAIQQRIKLNRTTFAYVFMLSFIILTSIGVGLIFPPAGIVVAGIGCGLFGFILGLE